MLPSTILSYTIIIILPLLSGPHLTKEQEKSYGRELAKLRKEFEKREKSSPRTSTKVLEIEKLKKLLPENIDRPVNKGKKRKNTLKNKIPSSNNFNKKSEDIYRTEELREYFEHLKEKALEILKYTNTEIRTTLNKNINLIDAINDDFLIGIQTYFSNILELKLGPSYHEDIKFLDLSEMVFRHLHREQFRMLNNTIAALNIDVESFWTEDKKKTSNKVLKDIESDFQTIIHLVHNSSWNMKADEMEYICDKYSICRQLPTFTDHCGYFLNEILNLPTKKRDILIHIMEVCAKINEDFLEITSRLKIIKHIRALIKSHTNGTNALQYFNDLKTILGKKFMIMYNVELNLEAMAPVVRIFLDIVDKSVQGERYDEFVESFQSTVDYLTMWNDNENSVPISKVIFKFLEKIFKELNNILHSNKTDINELIIMISMLSNETDSTNTKEPETRTKWEL